MRFRTGAEEGRQIWWEIEVTWEKRREIHQNKAVQIGTIGRGYSFVADTDKLLGLLWPECVKAWDDDRDLCEEEFWHTPLGHLDGLAVQVANWLVTGIEPNYDRTEEDPDAIPLELV